MCVEVLLFCTSRATGTTILQFCCSGATIKFRNLELKKTKNQMELEVLSDEVGKCLGNGAYMTDLDKMSGDPEYSCEDELPVLRRRKRKVRKITRGNDSGRLQRIVVDYVGAAFGFGALKLAAGGTTPVRVLAMGADVALQRQKRHDTAKRSWHIATIIMGNGDVEKHGLEMKKLKIHATAPIRAAQEDYHPIEFRPRVSKVLAMEHLSCRLVSSLARRLQGRRKKKAASRRDV